jgi:hypothetical protein
MYEIINKTFQPQPILLGGNTIIVPKRGSVVVEQLTPQLLNLKAKGYFKVKKI